MYRPAATSSFYVLTAGVLGLCMLNACTTIPRAEPDPCADQRRASRQTGSTVIACYTLEIPFHVTVLDEATSMPIDAAAVLRGQNVIDEPMHDGPALGWTGADGTLSTAVDTFIYTENPFTECFRQTFPGILIEILQEGYAHYRCRVPLPEAAGQVADLGVVYLRRTNDVSTATALVCMYTPLVVPIHLRILNKATKKPISSAEVLAHASDSEDGGKILGWSSDDGNLHTILKIHHQLEHPYTENNRSSLSDFSIEIRQEGFTSQRLPLQLPLTESMTVDLGDVYLARKEKTE